MSNSQDWQGVLGIPNPAPGDTPSIQSLAEAYGTVADNATQAANLIASVQARGTGQAMSAFAARLGSLPGHIQVLASSYHEASSALAGYATTLSGAQDQANQAWAQAGPAHQELGAAQQQVDYWQGQLAQLPSTDTGGRAQASANLSVAQGQQSDAQARLGAARSLATLAAETRQAAARTAATSLDEAANHSIPARSVWQQISDWFKDNPWFGWILTALAVILPFLGPIGVALGLVAGGILLGSQILDMALSGKWSAGDLVLGIASLIPGLGELAGLGKVVTKLGAEIADIAKTIPGFDRTFGALGGTAKAGLTNLSKEVHLSDDFQGIGGKTYKEAAVHHQPILDDKKNVIGINFQLAGDAAKRAKVWSKFDFNATEYNIVPSKGVVSNKVKLPWTDSKKVNFFQTHANADGFGIHVTDKFGKLQAVQVDGKNFAKIVNYVIKDKHAVYGHLLSRPDIQIYLPACKSGAIPTAGGDPIAKGFAEEIGFITHAPETNNVNASGLTYHPGGGGKTIINIKDLPPGKPGVPRIVPQIKTFKPAVLKPSGPPSAAVPSTSAAASTLAGP